MAAKKMREQLDVLKDISILEPVVTIKSVLKDENIETALLAGINGQLCNLRVAFI